MHIQLRCAGRVPALSTPVRQFKLAVSHLYRPESTLMAPIRCVRGIECQQYIIEIPSRLPDGVVHAGDTALCRHAWC